MEAKPKLTNDSPATAPSSDDGNKLKNILIGGLALSQITTFVRDNYSFVKEVAGDIRTLMQSEDKLEVGNGNSLSEPSATPQPQSRNPLVGVKWKRVGPGKAFSVLASDEVYVICSECVDISHDITGEEICTYKKSRPQERFNRSFPCSMVYNANHDSAITSLVTANCAIVPKSQTGRVIDIVLRRINELKKWDESPIRISQKKESSDFWYLQKGSDEGGEPCDATMGHFGGGDAKSRIRKDLATYFRD